MAARPGVFRSYPATRIPEEPEKKDRREFRAITGGIIHASSGAKKNLVEFDYEKIGARTFRISLKNVATGEYGFLAPGAAMSASATTLGKMYTIGLE